MSTGSLSFGAVLPGSTSAVQSYTVSGSNLTGDISINAPAGFEISTTSGSGFGPSLTLTQSGGSVATTTVFVRFVPGAPGAASGDITHNSSGATTQNVHVTGTGLSAEPTGQASNVTFSSIGLTSMNIGWTSGTGTNRLVTVKAGSVSTTAPTDGTSYTANTVFGSGSLIGTGSYVVYNGTGNSVAVTGLSSNTTYFVTVYEFNGSGGTENYLTTSPATGSRTTPISTTVVTWNFPNNPDNATADGGISPNLTKTISTVGGTSAVDFAAAGATTNAANATSWDGGSGTKYWLVSFVTTGYGSLTVSSKQRSSNTGPRDFKVQYSLDNSTWTDVPSSTLTTAADFTTGVLSNVALPTATANQPLVYLRWVMTINTSVANATVQSTGTSRIDDIVVTGVPVPSISVSPTSLAFGNVNVNSVSAEQSYSVSGSALEGSLVVAAPADYQVSATSGSGFGPGVTLTPDASGTVASTTIYVRFAPTASGAANRNVTNVSSGATTQNVSVTGTGIQTYTITATAGSNGSISPSGSVVVAEGASQGFNITANAGYHISDVTVDGLSVGTGSTYTFTNVTASHTISATFALDTFSISGKVTNGLLPLAGVSVTLNGSQTGSTTTDSAGNYTFLGLLNGEYTVTPATAGVIFNPLNRSVTVNGANQPNMNFSGTASLIISELRLSGEDSTDEFIELYNQTGSEIDVSGYVIKTGNGAVITIPAESQVIPRHGHFLLSGTTYTLSDYGGSGAASSDYTYPDDIPVLAGVSLVNPSNVTLDAVAFTSGAAGGEGTLLPGVSDAAQYSYVRKVLTTGFPQDTNDNAGDFWLVAPDPSLVSSATAVLGAPGPENSTGPLNYTSLMKSALLNPSVSSTASPNQARDTTSGGAGTPTAFGTLTLRRVFKNTTGGVVTRVRLRVTTITTTNSPGAGAAQADVRMITSAAETITVNSVPVDVRQVTLEEPPIQTKGGGQNASLVFDLPDGPLPDQSSVAVNITLGVAKSGTYRLAYTIEAVSAPSMTRPTTGEDKLPMGVPKPRR